MCWKNMMKWKEKSYIYKLHRLIKTFNVLMKQCYLVVWSALRKQIAKIQVVKTKNRRIRLYQTVWFVVVKNQDLSKNKKPVDY